MVDADIRSLNDQLSGKVKRQDDNPFSPNISRT